MRDFSRDHAQGWIWILLHSIQPLSSSQGLELLKDIQVHEKDLALPQKGLDMKEILATPYGVPQQGSSAGASLSSVPPE